MEEPCHELAGPMAVALLYFYIKAHGGSRMTILDLGA